MNALRFQNFAVFLLSMHTKYAKNCDVCHRKDETGVFQFVLDAFPPRPKMPFGQLSIII